jgi:hypothetical protein
MLPAKILVRFTIIIFLSVQYSFSYHILCSKKIKLLRANMYRKEWHELLLLLRASPKIFYEKYGVMNAVWVDAPKLRIMNNFQK